MFVRSMLCGKFGHSVIGCRTLVVFGSVRLLRTMAVNWKAAAGHHSGNSRNGFGMYFGLLSVSSVTSLITRSGEGSFP